MSWQISCSQIPQGGNKDRNRVYDLLYLCISVTLHSSRSRLQGCLIIPLCRTDWDKLLQPLVASGGFRPSKLVPELPTYSQEIRCLSPFTSDSMKPLIKISTDVHDTPFYLIHLTNI